VLGDDEQPARPAISATERRPTTALDLFFAITSPLM
jgi:hypothetical protein